MTIRRIQYNVMACDAEGCTAERKVWEGCDFDGWTARTEGKPWDGTDGGWRTAHYCPAHPAAPTTEAP